MELQNNIPVFVFHTIEPEIFENQLQYLKENKYNTLSLEEFYNHITYKSTAPDNSVLLTFDDARSSFWRYGFPLLSKYEMKGALFIIPGYTTDEEYMRLNLYNYWNNKCTLNEIVEQDINDETLCNWKEIKKIYSSGLVDIESHTLFHKEVFVDIKPVDFITSETTLVPYNSHATAYSNETILGQRIDYKAFYGFPLFKTSSLFSGNPFIIPNKIILDFCHNYYTQNSSKKGWKNVLVNKLTEDEFLLRNIERINKPIDFIYNDLVTSRQLIKTNINMEAGNHVCIPWTISSHITLKAVKKAGYKTCHLGLLPTKSLNKPGDDPFSIARIKSDFIFRLPGKNRRSLFSIYNYKSKRRIAKEQVF